MAVEMDLNIFRELRRQVVELIRKQMPVPVHRDVDACVAEMVLNRLWMDAAADQHRGKARGSAARTRLGHHTRRLKLESPSLEAILNNPAIYELADAIPGPAKAGRRRDYPLS